MSEPTMRHLAPALHLAYLIAEQDPGLPAAMISVSYTHPSTVEVSLHGDPGDMEPWRVALGIAPAEVRLDTHKGSSWLTASTTVRGVRVELTFHLPTPVAPRNTEGGAR
ncbi:hypothetical protein FH609_004300 [Streptomyces sp. 3MP-14]|uniref:Uncharacterized protein n=1 Tax=Streptomyces mimosae TaxID=2586635 RepID=A0A5N6A4M5_9ACTN|nr:MULTISPECIES: hypothetical protein [Streptomyces]KAB8162953.1 hypothetical protein FH607_020160 [Streptomyces mimosae]KAB8179167.1 hypothetical protein FH609_004300 [Streptomyces sp. 3MP-14]